MCALHNTLVAHRVTLGTPSESPFDTLYTDVYSHTCFNGVLLGFHASQSPSVSRWSSLGRWYLGCIRPSDITYLGVYLDMYEHALSTIGTWYGHPFRCYLTLGGTLPGRHTSGWRWYIGPDLGCFQVVLVGSE